MSRVTLRIGCQDGHFDALAHMVRSAASGVRSHDQSPRTGLSSQKCAFQIRILHIRSDRFARQEFAFLGESSSWSQRVRISSAAPNTASIVLSTYRMFTPTWTTALDSHARQPAEHRVALVASLWDTRDQHTRGRALDSVSRTHDRNPGQRTFRIAAAQEISSRRAARRR